MKQFQQFKRLSIEDIYVFWIRFDKLLSDVAACGAEIKTEMLFPKAAQAVELSPIGRFSALADMNNFANVNCPKNLRIVTQRL